MKCKRVSRGGLDYTEYGGKHHKVSNEKPGQKPDQRLVQITGPGGLQSLD